NDGYFLRDCGSRNGTLLNGRLVETETPLAEGDRIELGSSVLIFRATRPPEVGPQDRAVPLPIGAAARRPVLDLSGNTPAEGFLPQSNAPDFDPRPTIPIPAPPPPPPPPAPAEAPKPATKRLGPAVLAAIEGLAELPESEVLGRLALVARELVPS